MARVETTDSFALDSLAANTAVEHGMRVAPPNGSSDVRLVCLTLAGTDPSSSLLAAVNVREGITLRPGSACQVDTAGGRLTDRSLVADGSGLRGISVNTSRLYVASDSTVTFTMRYYQHYLSSADWLCTIRRRARQWILESCRMTRIS